MVREKRSKEQLLVLVEGVRALLDNADNAINPKVKVPKDSASEK